MEQMRVRDRIASLFHSSGIPKRFAERIFENYVAQTPAQKRALQLCNRLAEAIVADGDNGTSLILCGNPGTGKTHLACAIGSHLIEHCKSVQFATVLAAIRSIKDCYRKDSARTESEAIHAMVEPDLMIFDEIGCSLGSEHERMLIFDIINERYQQCRSTILISNLNREQLTDYLGERIMDRFRESGAVIPFDWSSYRGSKQSHGDNKQ
jgi:DNA replication protein DnaC